MAKKLFRDKATDDVGGAAALTKEDFERLRSGFDSTNWNAAVSFQCAVRDMIDRPVTLEQACRFAARVFRARLPDSIAAMRQWFDEETATHDAQRAETRRKERESIR